MIETAASSPTCLPKVTQAPNENSETFRPDLPKRRYCMMICLVLFEFCKVPRARQVGTARRWRDRAIIRDVRTPAGPERRNPSRSTYVPQSAFADGCSSVAEHGDDLAIAVAAGDRRGDAEAVHKTVCGHERGDLRRS